MALLTIATLLATMAAVTTGLALPESGAPVAAVEVEEVISVTMYQDANWSGTATSLSITIQTQCYGFEGGALDNSVSSIKVPDGYRCRFWDSNSCNGDSTPDIYAPGAKMLPADMNDSATSFKCYAN